MAQFCGIPNSFRFFYLGLLQTSLAASGDKEPTDGDPLVQGAELPGAARSPGSASVCVCRVCAGVLYSKTCESLNVFLGVCLANLLGFSRCAVMSKKTPKLTDVFSSAPFNLLASLSRRPIPLRLRTFRFHVLLCHQELFPPKNENEWITEGSSPIDHAYAST